MYQIQTDNFSGPIEKLLELIEKNKLDITQISLSEVTTDFLSFVKELEQDIKKESNWNAEKEKISILSDFLVVAATLILLKSKALIPNLNLLDEDEEKIEDLEYRLNIYRNLKPIFLDFDNLWKEKKEVFFRRISIEDRIFFNPSSNISLTSLSLSISSALKMAMPFTKEHKEIKRKKISLQDTINNILEIISERGMEFSRVIENNSKEEVVAKFLALLHLLRDNLLVVDQNDMFGEINIRKSN